jgi:hypothetical protein
LRTRRCARCRRRADSIRPPEPLHWCAMEVVDGRRHANSRGCRRTAGAAGTAPTAVGMRAALRGPVLPRVTVGALGRSRQSPRFRGFSRATGQRTFR